MDTMCFKSKKSYDTGSEIVLNNRYSFWSYLKLYSKYILSYILKLFLGSVKKILLASHPPSSPLADTLQMWMGFPKSNGGVHNTGLEMSL
jgi:hypothetical protein